MTVLNSAEAKKEIRAAAKAHGLTFKRSDNDINGKPAYEFCRRASGETVRNNVELGTAYDIACSGELENY